MFNHSVYELQSRSVEPTSSGQVAGGDGGGDGGGQCVAEWRRWDTGRQRGSSGQGRMITHTAGHQPISMVIRQVGECPSSSSGRTQHIHSHK